MGLRVPGMCFAVISRLRTTGDGVGSGGWLGLDCSSPASYRGYYPISPSPLTSLRSASSSSVVILMRSWANALCEKPSTTDQLPLPSELTGKPNWRPSGAPYWPELATATEKESPGVVAVRRLTTV